MRPDTDHPAYVLAFVLVVSAVFTAGIMTVHVVTQDRVARNEALRLEKALVELFGLGDPERMGPEAVSRAVARRVRRGVERTDPQTGQSFEVIEAYDRPAADPHARLVGIAFPVSGRGFWAPIRGLLAVSPDLNDCLGVVFLDHGETPGLGARIDEAGFRRRFRGLRVRPAGRDDPCIYIGRGEPSGPADRRYGRSVDAITGATQTSVALERLLDASIRRFYRAYAPPGSGPASAPKEP